MNNIIKKVWKNPEISKAITNAEKQDEDTYSFIYLNTATGKVHTDKIIISKSQKISLTQNFMKNMKMWSIVLESDKNGNKNTKRVNIN